MSEHNRKRDAVTEAAAFLTAAENTMQITENRRHGLPRFS